MAAYASLLSLMHTLHHINNHPSPPISLHPKQVNCLTQNLTFLQNYLERYSSEEDNDLETRIADAAYAAEDVIEIQIVDQIQYGSSSSSKYIFSAGFYQHVERVIQQMDMIKKEVTEIIKEKTGGQHHDQLRKDSSSTASTRRASTGQISTWGGYFDDVLINEVLDKLTRQKCHLQIIPIVGMGGIGKTTFARNIYETPLIVQHFDIHAWVTISLKYSRREILRLLCQETKGGKSDDLGYLSEDEIGEILYKHLCGRRYLIVMDDIWSSEAWDEIKSFFPNNNNRSRIMMATRLSNLGFQLGSSHNFQMKFLDDDKSWNFLSDIVFGKELDCPIELENIGKVIAKKCKGLPLSIIVVGGLLAKSNMTPRHWEYTLENLNALINMEDNEYCLQVLRTSYKELPVHLKSCFLYMGVFPEDQEIRVSELIKLWVAEGILKPIDDKRLEEVAQEYVNELIDRKLILVHKLRWNGEAKVCKIHDLLRDLCLREAQKQSFLCVLSQWDEYLNIARVIDMERRICISKHTQPQVLHALTLAFCTRSLLMNRYICEPSESSRSTLLRVYKHFDWHVTDIRSAVILFQQVNMRYLSLRFESHALSNFTLLLSSSLLWNLQTLEVIVPSSSEPTIAPFKIWEMPLLRQVVLDGFQLPDPPCGEDKIVLDNLQTLSKIINFNCSEDVVKRIPNIKKLGVECRCYRLDEGLPNLGVNNFGDLQKLESFNLEISTACLSDIVESNLVLNITLPHSLRKLTLSGTMMSWEDLMAKIGSLPFLQVLRLNSDSCVGSEWETTEGQFCSLKILVISGCSDLKQWKTDNTHFPRLEHLHLIFLRKLEEIPLGIGDIPTLKSIELLGCSKSAEDSAKRMKEEQEENGNEQLQFQFGKISFLNIMM